MARTMAVSAATRPAGTRWRPVVLAVGLWALVLLGLVATAWLNHLLRRAGRLDLALRGHPGADGAGGAERGHRWGRRGQPPPVAPGWLAAARPRAVGAVVGCARRLGRLRGAGPARVAAGRPLPGGLQPSRLHGRAGLRGLRAAADPQRVAAVAVAPLALVGQGPRRRASGVPADRAGRVWLAGGAVPPCSGAGTPAAALAGVRRRPGLGGRGPGAGRHLAADQPFVDPGPDHLGRRSVPGPAATGDRRRHPALPPV